MIRVSKHLALIILLLVIMGVGNSIYIYGFAQKARNDMMIINRCGIIRGSIQRVVGKETNGINSDSVILIVDKTIADISKIDGSYRFMQENGKCQQGFHNLQQEWSDTKAHIRSFRKHPNEKDRAELLVEGDRIWKLSDDLVADIQAESQRTVFRLQNANYFIAVNIVVIIAVLIAIEIYLRNRLEFLANYDALTRVYNRSVFEKKLDEEIYRAARYKKHLSLIYFDIDHFKSVNDTFGHKQGDSVLRELARVVNGCIRKSDALCRIGGEEFAVVLSETDHENAIVVAEKIKNSMHNGNWGKAGQITVSLGIASYKNGKSAEEFKAEADRYLYIAKNNGRNCIQAANT